jgi:putative ABC transport system substrate-binding protein
MLPQVKNVGVIYSSEENRILMQQADKLLAKQGLTLHQVQIDDPAKIMDALKRLERRVDVLLGLTDSTVLNTSTAKDVLLFSLRNRIAFVGLSEAWVKAGAIYALERDYQDMGRQCGEMALKILAGQQPEALKPVSPRTVRYFLNQQIAERLKINVSDELIANAEAVF